MTANQLALQSNIETERHNRATENIDARHNVATEELTRQANENQRMRNENDRIYQDRITAIDGEYKRALIAMQTAQGNEKLMIENRLASLTSQRNDAERRYWEDTASYNFRKNEIDQMMKEETARHNAELELLTLDQQEKSFALENKKLQYQATFVREQNSIRRSELTHEKNKSQNIWELDQSRNSAEVQKLQAETDLIKAKEEHEKAETKFTNTQNFLKPIETGSNIGGTIIKNLPVPWGK